MRLLVALGQLGHIQLDGGLHLYSMYVNCKQLQLSMFLHNFQENNKKKRDKSSAEVVSGTQTVFSDS